VLLFIVAPAALEAQQATTLDETIEAGEAQAEEPARRLVNWNEFDGKFFSIRLGGGFLVDYGAYSQDETSQAQIALGPDLKVRDARFSLKGRLKFKRSVTWTCGLMYNGPTDEFLVRETGIMVEVPEIFGHVFVGRTKEGFSLNKVMVGYAGWTMERSTISDATIPILADRVKWLGYAPRQNLLWNLGFYGDWLSQGQSFFPPTTIRSRGGWHGFLSSRRLPAPFFTWARASATGRPTRASCSFVLGRSPSPRPTSSIPARFPQRARRPSASKRITGRARCSSAASISFMTWPPARAATLSFTGETWSRPGS
jgi:hypothetical protein